MAGYQLKITLEDTKPLVWRRVIVPDRITFGDLHSIIQAVFGWEDMHLHDFSFSGNSQIHIGSAEEWEYYENSLDEDTVCLDEYIKNYKWIRYLYAPEDDWDYEEPYLHVWRHKIILEQECSDYDKRYPQVIKYKGDNFTEYNGDPFFGEDEGTVRDIFDMQDINSWMEKNLVFKRVRKQKKGTNITTINKKGQQKTRTENFIAAMNEMLTQNQPEFDETTLELWDETMNEFQALIEAMAGMDMGRKSLMEKKLEQLDWYFHEEGEFSPIGIKSNIKKAAPKRSHKEVLLDLQKDELREIATALGIHFAKSWNKEKLSSEIASQLQGHPEYLYYLLDKKEFSEFLKFAQAPEGNFHGKLPIHILRTMLWWGYIDVDFWTGMETTVTLSIPKEIEDIIKGLEHTNWRKKCGNIEKTAGEITRLLLYYGCVELEKFYELCTNILRPMAQEEFYHYIYFTIDGRNHMWVVEEDNIKYICFGELDVEYIMNCREENVQDIDYCNLTLLDVERWKRGIGVVYPEWKEFAQLLWEAYDMSGDSVNELIEFELYPAVVEGTNLTELMNMAENLIEMEGIEPWLLIWEALQDIFLHTRIAGLKGYTREQLAEIKRMNPFAIASSKEERQKKRVELSDHMYETPLEYQKQISELLREEKNNPSLAAEKLEKLLEKYNREHYESRFLLARLYRESDQLEKSRTVMKSLAEDTGEQELKKLLTAWEKEDGVAFDNRNLKRFSRGRKKKEK